MAKYQIFTDSSSDLSTELRKENNIDYLHFGLTVDGKDEYLADLDIDNLGNILTLTMHRAENVDVKERVRNIIDALKELSEMNIIFPIHPRTKNTLQNFGLFDELNDLDHVHIIKPLGYLDFLLLTSKSTLTSSEYSIVHS